MGIYTSVNAGGGPSGTGLTALDCTGSGTISYWWKGLLPLGTSGLGNMQCYHWTSATNRDGWALRINTVTTGWRLVIANGVGVSNHTTGNAVFQKILGGRLPKWRLITVTWDGTTVTFYVDGVPIEIVAQGRTITAAGTRNTIMNSDGGTQNFPMLMSTIAYWKAKALNKAEVMALYKQGPWRLAPTATWGVGPSNGTDVSGSGNGLTDFTPGVQNDVNADPPTRLRRWRPALKPTPQVASNSQYDSSMRNPAVNTLLRM